MEPFTSIIIPTALNPEAVARIRDLIECNTSESHEVIVVDTSPLAVGCVHSSNIGLAEAVGDILVVMNDDCQPQPGWLGPLVGAIQERAIALCSPYWRYARLGGHCLAFPRATYEITGGYDERYRHWCADHHFELTVIDAEKLVAQVPSSSVIHDPSDSLRAHYKKSAKIGNYAELPNTGQWYLEDQAIFESIWGERRVADHYPDDWSEPRGK